MKNSSKLTAAIEILADFEARHVPLKTAIADWGRSNRYAGAKDRAWISGLCLDVLRKRHSLGAAMGSDTPRALVLAAARFLWAMPVETITELAVEEPYGPGALTDTETKALSALSLERADGNEGLHIGGDFPEWLVPQVERVFGASSAQIMSAFAQRADVDLRINTLKSTPEKTLAALKTVKGEAAPILTNAARIDAPDPSQKAPAVTIIPAFNKGWVEVQDLGSQIAAAAAGDIKGGQVLDYCAGGGGKSLALAALMENTGQLYAYDRDARRLKPLYSRAKRAGVRNIQVINPLTDKPALASLEGKMDVVFVDAPCSGAGTWRRHPDTKWRLTEKQLATRMREQDQVLEQAAKFVKPGGRMVWVTCSFLMEENEDRLAGFLDQHKDFQIVPVLEAVTMSGLLTEEAGSIIRTCVTSDGNLRLTPDKIRADGFFVSVMQMA